MARAPQHLLADALPGVWLLTFSALHADGAGRYTFKPAGTFSAVVQSFAGEETRLGYWQVQGDTLHLFAQVYDPACGCLAAGREIRWRVALEMWDAATGTAQATLHDDADDSAPLALRLHRAAPTEGAQA